METPLICTETESDNVFRGGETMLVGYCRVSMADDRQTTDLQQDALLAVGIDRRNIYEDRTSGAKDNRPGLKACLKYLTEGDILVGPMTT